MNKSMIIIPAYKPTSKMIPFVKEMATLFEKIIIIDDGSGDSYKKIFDELKHTDGVEVLTHYVNMGKGRALKTAFNYCYSFKEKFENVITCDADGQHRISDILKVSRETEKEKCFVLGCRCFDDRAIPFRSRFGNKISQRLYKLLCGIDVSDTQTGLRGIPIDFLPTLCCVNGERYEYETNMLVEAVKNGIKFKEVSIETVYEDNNAGSHFNPLKDSIKIYNVVFQNSVPLWLSGIIDVILFVCFYKLGYTVVLSTCIARALSVALQFCLNGRKLYNQKDKIAKAFAIVFILCGASAFLVSILSNIMRVSPVLIKIIIDICLYTLADSIT